MRILSKAATIIAITTMMASTTTTVALSQEHKIGLTATYSGDFAAYGVSLRNGAELAVKQKTPSGLSVSLEIVDDKGSAQDGVLIAQRFCSDKKVVGVLGYTFSSIALAAVPIYDECHLPILASAVTSPELSNSSPFFHRDVMTDASQGKLMGEFAAKKLGLKNIYVLNQQDDYGIGVADAFKAAAQASGATIAGSEAYQLNSTDFRTILAKAKTTNPDAIFIGGFYAEGAKILKQARQLGIKAQFLGTDGALNTQMLSLAKDAANGLIAYGMFHPAIVSPASAEFVAAYKSAYGSDPDVWAALGYDAATVMLSALNSVKDAGDGTRDALNKSLGETKGMEGVTGPMSFTESGDREGTLYFLQVKDGSWHPYSSQ